MKYFRLPSLKPYTAGIYADSTFDKQQVIRLSLSESPYGISVNARKVINEELEKLSCYPDSNYEDLRKLIAAKHCVNEKQVLIGNGVDELILLSALALINPRDYGITTEKTFAGYLSSIEIVGGNCLLAELENFRISVKNIEKQIDDLKKEAIVYLQSS